MRKLGTIASMSLAAVLFFVCMGVLALRMLGLGTFIVTGSSMEPSIHRGSLAMVEPVSPSIIRPGDIITFEHYGQMTTHRVVTVDASGNPADPVFTTKGDANAAADPEPVHFPAQVGLYRTSIPLLGFAVAYAQAYWRLALMFVAALGFLGSAAMLVFGNARPARTRRQRTVPVTGPIDPDELWASHIGWLREATARRVAA